MELALLRAIPGMGVHSAALPFVNRALDQLLPTGENSLICLFKTTWTHDPCDEVFSSIQC